MFILLSIRSIFSSMFITLLVATTTLDGLPPYRTVLNCFHLLWTIVFIYFKLFWYILLSWFYRLIIVHTFKLFIFKLRTLFSLQYYCAYVSSHRTSLLRERTHIASTTTTTLFTFVQYKPCNPTNLVTRTSSSFVTVEILYSPLLL